MGYNDLMALLQIEHRSWFARIPIVGKLAPTEKETRITQFDPCLKMRVTERPKGWRDWLASWERLPLIGWFFHSPKPTKGDHLVIDTGDRLIDIAANRLDLKNIHKGDRVSFKLDPTIDPGGFTDIEGDVALVYDDPEVISVQSRSGVNGVDGKPLNRPISRRYPVEDLVLRRAELFQAFKGGLIAQAALGLLWDAMRKQALDIALGWKGSNFEKQQILQDLMDIGAVTPADIQGTEGIQVVEVFLPLEQPKTVEA